MWWSWTDVNLEEMKAFLGVVLNMGMNPKPEIIDYFSSDWIDYQSFLKTYLVRKDSSRFFGTYTAPPHQLVPFQVQRHDQK